MSRWTPGRTGPLAHWYRKARRVFLAANPICWSCGHDQADEIDHVIQASVAPWLAYVISNWRPSHSVKGCPICGRRCNRERSTTPGAPTGSPRSRRW